MFVSWKAQKNRKMDDEMDGRVMDDTAGRQSLSAAGIKNKKKKKKKKKKKLEGGGQNASRSKMKTERHEGGEQTWCRREEADLQRGLR